MTAPRSNRVRSSDVYVMGGTSEEYQRLKRQAQIWEKATVAILEDSGLKEGMSCLDVGCGPGEVMRLMGQRVGRQGRVTGFDIDGKIGREGLAVLKSQDGNHYEFIEGSADEHLDGLGQNRYDLVYARFLFLHLKDPVSVLRKMYEMTKQGGAVVVQDYDFRTWEEFTSAGKEIRRVFFAVFERAGRDVTIGSKLPGLFVQAGLGQPDGTRVDGLITPPTPMPLAVYQSVLPLALKFGITTEAESQAISRERSRELQDTRASPYGLWPLCIGAWKRK